jgi:hypothetical protein
MMCGLLISLLAGSVSAHCDRLDGPVARDATAALEQADFAAIAVWVGPEQEAELRVAFNKARKVRAQSDDAMELADLWFIETAVRLHREAEGMPYTGVKPAGRPTPEDISAADRAYADGDVEPVITLLQETVARHVRHLFERARNTRSDTQDIESGREAVDAYVRYIVYVHGLYGTIQAGPEHGVSD